MKVIDCTSETDAITFNGKILGVFETPGGMEEFARLLEGSDVESIEVLSGAEGARCLQEVKGSLSGFLDAVLGDMESGMLKVYLQAVERGGTVFAIRADPEMRDEIILAAVQFGAKHIAHFGSLVNESFETLTGDAPA